MSGEKPSITDQQSGMNRSTRGQWDWYARQRAEIEKLIVPRARGGRICVLGAGNCNDLDLKWLVQVYRQVRLVDIDRAALERAAERQGVAGRVTLDAPIDLTQSPAAGDGEGFDVVLSPCVLSQLLCGVRDAVGKDSPEWPRLKREVRARHVTDVMDLLKPGGRGVLVVDLSSTGTIPGLDRAAEDQWPDLMRLAVRDGKCFRGTEPQALREVIAGDARLRGMVARTELSEAWVWHLGWGKAFLVYGMTLTRR